MKAPTIPADEDERLASLRRMCILSTPVEAEFDRITRTAARLFGVPIALVSLVDGNRQWFKSRHGLAATETPRDVSFCGHAILSDAALVVEDTHADDRFRDNPLVVGEPAIRFYAGRPLSNADGFRIGTLCLIDREPRPFQDGDEQALDDLARWTELALHARALSDTQLELLSELDAANRERLIDPLTGVWNRRGLDQLLEREVATAQRRGEPLGVWFLDVDHFKEFNDACGHEAGDRALHQCASLITANLRPYDAVCRFGGDEFVCLMPGLGRDHIAERANSLLALVRSRGRIDVDGTPQQLSISIGMTWLPPRFAGDARPARILERADEALYLTKQARRGTATFLEL